MNYAQFNLGNFQSDPRFARVFSTVRGQPSWIWKLASLAAAVVIIVPILAIILAAVAAFILIFAVLSLLNAVGRGLDSLAERFTGRGSGGRRNVRVVREN